MNSLLAQLIKHMRQKILINSISDEKGNTTKTWDIQRFMRNYYKQLCVNKSDVLEEMDRPLKQKTPGPGPGAIVSHLKSSPLMRWHPKWGTSSNPGACTSHPVPCL